MNRPSIRINSMQVIHEWIKYATYLEGVNYEAYEQEIKSLKLELTIQEKCINNLQHLLREADKDRR